MKYLIYAANLHVGGGVQAATSVIFELSILKNEASKLVVWVSSEIDENLDIVGACKSNFSEYIVINHYGLSAFLSRFSLSINSYDCIFILFGPHYLGYLSSPVIMGFAQPWIINTDSSLYSLFAPFHRLIVRVKYWFQGLLFNKADWLVVELDHVKDGLIRKGIGVPEKIIIVRNCIASIYWSPVKWNPLRLPDRKSDFRLGFLGRNYPHKNTNILSKALILLRENYKLDVELLVTFTDSEWSECSQEFRNLVINIGPLQIAECPNFYKSLDAVIFPSLLECFSATPLEAMAMNLPLIASDREFIRDVCGDYARYFDPLDPDDISRVIADALLSPPNEIKLNEARKYATEFSNPRGRAHEYMQILHNAVQQKVDKEH